MLKVGNIEVTGWEAAIRGMRNPMNSWEKSDTEFLELETGGDFSRHTICDSNWSNRTDYISIGQNDLDLMKRLAKGGSVHAKYRRMINVTMDITAPLYW